MVDAIPALTDEKSVRLFRDYGVFSEKELISRMEVKYETYSKDMNIEARTMLEMTSKLFLPAMIRGAGSLASSVSAIEAAGADASVSRKLLVRLNDLIKEASDAREKLLEATLSAEKNPAGRTQALLFRDKVVPAMKALRKPVDEAEMIVDKQLWPVPSYADLMFEV